MSQPSFDFEWDDRQAYDDPADLTYSVGELAQAINARLNAGFPDGVWVRGEITDYKVRGPHCYFQLVEDGPDGEATLRVSLFANVINRIRPVLKKAGLRLVDGLSVRIYGALDYYAPRGTLSLTMAAIDTRFTLGDLAQRRQDTIRRLVASGLYDANRQLPLSPVPLRIGVVTSAQSAAWADFRTQLEASGIGFQLRLINCKVQGDDAVPMVSAAIRTLGRHDDLDVVVVIRGGGARSELAVFDHADIAVAIGRSGVPVFTGLGHEIDTSVADEVAHRRLKTPTAVAADLIDMVRGFSGEAEAAYRAIERRAARVIDDHQARLDRCATGIQRSVLTAVDRGIERLDLRRARLQAGAGAVLDVAARRLDSAAATVRRSGQRLPTEQRHLDSLAARVRLLDPVHTMARGWSITRTTDGTVVRDAAQLTPGQQIVTAFAAGTATSTVGETVTTSTESDGSDG